MSHNQSERPALESLKSQNMEEENQPNLPYQDEQLIEREPLEGTPFTLITREKKSFIAFGRYKISEEYDSKELALGSLTNDFWNILLNVIQIILDNQEKK